MSNLFRILLVLAPVTQLVESISYCDCIGVSIPTCPTTWGYYPICNNNDVFVQCVWGVVHIQTCPAPLIWDCTQSACVLPPATPSAPTTASPTTASPTAAPIVLIVPAECTSCVDDCSNTAVGYYRDCNDASAYVQCDAFGGLHNQACPGGLVWDDKANTCVYPPSSCDPTTTADPTTAAPTVLIVSASPTAAPTTANPTTAVPTTADPTTADLTTAVPTTASPTTADPTTAAPTTASPTAAPISTTATSTTTTSTTAGTFGKWSSYGGSAKNQQMAPIEANVILNQYNVNNLSLECTFFVEEGREYVGYITIDDQNYGYITNGPNAMKINLTNCTAVWSVNVAQLLGYNSSTNMLRQRHVATLFENSNGDRGIIFGAPSHGRVGISNWEPCFAVALDINNGELLWYTVLGQGLESYKCKLNGFMVDGKYAFGGMAVSSSRDGLDIVAVNRGKMFKLDLDDGHIVDIWYSIDSQKFGVDENTVNVSDPYIYRGASVWQMSAVIDDYLIFGTGNMWTHPKYIEKCLLANFDAFPMEDAYPFDACGNNRSSDEKFWRCLEQGVYPCSFIILNKHTFNVEAAIPLQGIDTEDIACRNGWVSGCMRVQGPDSDLAAVAAFSNNGKLYGAAAQKSGHFYVFEIPSGKVVIAKKIGSWSFSGGNQWSVAVDEMNMIGIITITGGNLYDQQYKTVLADGTELCQQTGSVHAINLTSSHTIWQSANPWGTINDCNDVMYDEYVDYAEPMQCITENIKNASETVMNIVIPPINELERSNIVSSGAGRLVAPVTIVNDMVFVASYSGDIYIYNLFDGEYIHTLQCPNRQEIKGGITVFDDRVIFYCGRNQLVSMQIQY